MTLDMAHGIRPATLAEEELNDVIHQLLSAIFKNPKRGYNWLVPKFGKSWRGDPAKMNRIITCLTSKKMQFKCPVHTRLHSKPRI